jgi:zinc protease
MFAYAIRICQGLLFSLLLYPLSTNAGLFDAKTFTLKNGLRVYVIENHRTNLVTQVVCYNVGTADDPLGKSGLAHYLEHMMFKGPKGSSSATMMQFVANVGGTFNAETGQDTTKYFETVSKKHLETVMKMEADRMKNLEVLPEQAIPELKVITEERKMRIDNDPMGQFFLDLFAAFFRHHPYKNPTIGWEEEILGYTPEDVKGQHVKWYAPNNAILVLSGDITLAEAKQLAEKYYGPIPSKTIPERKRVVEPPLTVKISVESRNKNVDQPYVALMYRAPTYRLQNERQVFALEVLQQMLGGSLNSILYHKLVEELKLATSVTAQYSDDSIDPSGFIIFAQVSPTATLPQLEKALHETIEKLVQTGVTAEQVEKAKTQIRASMFYIRDSVTSGATSFANYLSVGFPLEVLETIPDRINKVTAEDVNQAIKTVLDTRNYVSGYLIAETKPEAPATKAVQKDSK